MAAKLSGAPTPPSCPSLSRRRASCRKRSSTPPTPSRPTGSRYNKGYKGFRYSTLDQINAGNASKLRAVCVLQLGEVGTFQTGPVIHEGVMYVTTSHGVYALDATTCDRRWEYHYTPSAPEVQVNNKGVAISDGRPDRGTTDGSLIALDAATGKLLWLRKIMDVTKGEFAVAAPLIYNGVVYIGKAGADWGIAGEMMAFDASDGTKLWGTPLLPKPGDPAFATWKNPASVKTGGGSTWSSYSLDTDAKLLLVPVGNAAPDYNKDSPARRQPLHELARRARRADRRDQVVASATARRTTRISIRRWSRPSIRRAAEARGGRGQGWRAARRRSRDRHAALQGAGDHAEESRRSPTTESGLPYCPGAGVLNNGPAFSPATNLIYINSQDSCAVACKRPAKYISGSVQRRHGQARSGRSGFGWTSAIDATTGEFKWRYRSPEGIPMLGSVTPTAGNVVFTGDTAGYFLVFNATTGDVLYRFNTGGVLGGGVATYSVKGTQYVTVMSGNTSFHPYKAGGAATVLVFGLTP